MVSNIICTASYNSSFIPVPPNFVQSKIHKALFSPLGFVLHIQMILNIVCISVYLCISVSVISSSCWLVCLLTLDFGKLIVST